MSGKFIELTQGLPAEQRIPLLLHVYSEYRALGHPADDEHRFRWSIFSILISTLLKGVKKLGRQEALGVLSNSFHYCGHGDDVSPPLELALRSYDGTPFDRRLFDAAASYRQNLKGLRSWQAHFMRQRLDWILWLDPRRALMPKQCCTSRIQQGIWGLEREEQFRWEWLLRHVSGNQQLGPGKAWTKEGLARLRSLGEERFDERVALWLVPPSESSVPLSPAGSNMLKLLVWYAGLANTPNARNAVLSLPGWEWCRSAACHKVITAVQYLAR